MELKPIFVDDETREGLYAIQYYDDGIDEFERLFDLWNDAEHLHNYCITNKLFFETDYFEGISIDRIETKIINEAAELECLLEEFAKDGFENNGRNLQMLFKPLNNKEHELPIHQETKARVDDRRNFPKPILRIYAIRLGDNTFVITGGAIKITKFMKDHPDTDKELEKIITVKLFLKRNGITIDDDLNYYYEQSEG